MLRGAGERRDHLPPASSEPTGTARNPFHRAAVAWGTPIDVSGVGRGAKAYRAIAQAVEEELRALREFLFAAQQAGFPRDAVPPVSRSTVEVPA